MSYNRIFVRRNTKPDAGSHQSGHNEPEPLGQSEGPG